MNRFLLFSLGVFLLLAAPLQFFGQTKGYRALKSANIHIKAAEDQLAETLRGQIPALQSKAVALKLNKKKKSPAGTHYSFQQIYRGIPIQDAGIRVLINQEGQLISWIDHLASISSDQGQFPTSPNNKSYVLPTYEINIKAKAEEVWIMGEQNELIPAYRYHHVNESKGINKEILIDAHQGRSLDETDLNLHFHSRVDSPRGHVFLPNPCTRAGVSYGELFSDKNDQHQVSMNPFLDTVALRDLTQRGGRYFLEGPYVKLEDIAAPNLAPVSSVDGNFFFTRDQSGFEDVMCYYHIDRYQRYVQDLGFLDLNNAPLRVDSHGGTGDNSLFSPNGGNSTIRFGIGGVDDAEDGDVIVHEYCHALEHDAAGSFSGVVRLGIAEGNADYIAASYSQDLQPVGWERIFNWDGHNEFWPGFFAISELTFPLREYDPDSPGDVNRYVQELRELWASTLMILRNDIGAEAADKIVLQAFYGYTPGINIETAVQVLLEAEGLVHGGIYQESLRFILCQSGLLMGPECISVGISNPSNTLGWQIYPNPNRGNVQLQNVPKTATSLLKVYSPTGQLIKEISLRDQPSRIQMNLPTGIYLVSLFESGIFQGSRKLLVQP